MIDDTNHESVTLPSTGCCMQAPNRFSGSRGNYVDAKDVRSLTRWRQVVSETLSHKCLHKCQRAPYLDFSRLQSHGARSALPGCTARPKLQVDLSFRLYHLGCNLARKDTHHISFIAGNISAIHRWQSYNAQPCPFAMSTVLRSRTARSCSSGWINFSRVA